MARRMHAADGRPTPKPSPTCAAAGVLVRLLLAASHARNAAAQAGNWCGDDYEDSRKCTEPCIGTECMGPRSCFAVESCAVDDPVLPNAFCGEDYTEAAACDSAAACPSGRIAECNPGSQCFAVTTCRPRPPAGPAPLPADPTQAAPTPAPMSPAQTDMQSNAPPAEAPAPRPAPVAPATSPRAPAPTGVSESPASQSPRQAPAAPAPAAPAPPLPPAGTATPTLPPDVGALGCSAEMPCPAGQRCEGGGCRDEPDGIGAGAIAGTAVGAVAALLLLAVALWAWQRHRRHTQRQGEDVVLGASKVRGHNARHTLRCTGGHCAHTPRCTGGHCAHTPRRLGRGAARGLNDSRSPLHRH